MEEVALSTSDLITVAGASAAAVAVTEFIKRLFGLGATGARSVSMVAGLVVLVTAVWSTTGFTGIPDAIFTVIVGMQAGLAASAGFDAVKEGLAHETFPAEVKN